MILMLQLTKVISKLLKQIIFEIFRGIDNSNNTSDQCQNRIYILSIYFERTKLRHIKKKEILCDRNQTSEVVCRYSLSFLL